MRTLIRPTAFVDSPFGHDGKVARLAGGLNWFAAVELIADRWHQARFEPNSLPLRVSKSALTMTWQRSGKR